MWCVKRPAIPWSTPTPGGISCKARIKVYGTPIDVLSNFRSFSIKLASDSASLVIQLDGFIRRRRDRDRRESTVSVMSMLDEEGNVCQDNTICITNQIAVGARFYLKIKASNNIFSVFINHQLICSFTAHILPYQVHSFSITGDVNVEKIVFYHFPRIDLAFKTFTRSGKWNAVLNGGFHSKLIDTLGTMPQDEKEEKVEEIAREMDSLKVTNKRGGIRFVDTPQNNIVTVEKCDDDS